MNTVACNEFVEQATAFLDGSLDPAAERALVDHLALCDDCATYLDQFRRVIDDLGDLPADHLPDEAREALLAAFRNLPR